MPDKDFGGADRGASSRSGPVQFEKEENDPFGLDAFLKEVKTAERKRPNEDDRRNDRLDYYLGAILLILKYIIIYRAYMIFITYQSHDLIFESEFDERYTVKQGSANQIFYVWIFSIW